VDGVAGGGAVFDEEDVVKMRISGSGIARNGLRSVKERKELYIARDAISCLHDALLAVARGRISPDDVKSFFWLHDLDTAEYIGGLLSFDSDAPASGTEGG